MVDTRFPVSLHIMVLLAHHAGEVKSSAYLASSLRTNPAFVRKLVGRLVAAGLIESTRGKGGGLRLAKSARSVSLKDIYMASVQDKSLVCLPKKAPKASCAVSCSMGAVLSSIVGGIETATQVYLDKTSLEDILKKVSR